MDGILCIITATQVGGYSPHDDVITRSDIREKSRMNTTELSDRIQTKHYQEVYWTVTTVPAEFRRCSSSRCYAAFL